MEEPLQELHIANRSQFVALADRHAVSGFVPSSPCAVFIDAELKTNGAEDCFEQRALVPGVNYRELPTSTILSGAVGR